MKINEIVLAPIVDFPMDHVERLLTLNPKQVGTIDQFQVKFLEDHDQRVLIITDGDNIAAVAGFISRINDHIWQTKNLQVFNPYKGKNLAARIYKFVKEILRKSIQSDVVQSQSARKLWTEILPKHGLNPKIFDTKTKQIKY